MPLMKPLSGVGQVNVNDDDVERYEAAGWTKVSGSTKKTTDSSKSASSSSKK
jgi:hypothetical protein